MDRIWLDHPLSYLSDYRLATDACDEYKYRRKQPGVIPICYKWDTLPSCYRWYPILGILYL